jgi:serine/threonine protein kinase
MSSKGNTPTRMGPARELTPDEKLIAEKLGDQYELLEKLGAGGMGIVYKARLVSLQTLVAVKIVRDTAGDDAQAIKRLRNEAQALGALDHPNVVRVMHLQRLDDNQLALVMEYVEGKDLSAILEEDGKLQPQRARALLKQCAEAMAAAHSAGIIHRDLKPSNIVVMRSAETTEEKIKILDFGLAKLSEAGNQKLTRTGNIMGSPAYMSPEQVCAEQLDARCDIYSLGCVFFEALSGSVPFAGDTVFDVLLKHTSERVPDLDIPDKQLSSIISKCTEPNPADRFQSAADLIEALSEKTFKHQRSATHPVIAPAARKRSLIMRLAVAGCCIAIAVAVATATLLPPKLEPPKKSDPDLDRANVMRLVLNLHSDVKDGLKPTQKRLDEIRRLEPAITKVETAIDLGNAYADLNLHDDAKRVRIWVIAHQRAKHVACNHEVARIAKYEYAQRHFEEAQRFLEEELAYEQSRVPPAQSATIAKCYLDLALLGFLTHNKALQANSTKAMNESVKSEFDQDFLVKQGTPNEDELFHVAYRKDKKFALGLIKAKTDVHLDGDE